MDEFNNTRPRTNAMAMTPLSPIDMGERSPAGDSSAVQDRPVSSSASQLLLLQNKMKLSGEPPLLEGEEILRRANFVHEFSRGAWVQGTLFLTNYQVMFVPTNYSTYEDVPAFEGSQIPLLMIHRVEKIGGKSTKAEHTYLIEIHTKDMRIVRFSFVPSNSKRREVFEFLRHYTIPSSIQRFFCFYHRIDTASNNIVDGWKIYQPLKEFTRQGVFKPGTTAIAAASGVTMADGSSSSSNMMASHWRLSDANKDYALSNTYPPQICVPTIISDAELIEVSAYRSKGRIPALTWYHEPTGVAIVRSSQPLSGVFGKSSKDDQRLIETIQQTNSNCDKLQIIDLRPRANAEANRVMGMGYEKNYKNCELKFMGIDNIHVMRESFRKVVDLCMATNGMDPQWSTKIEATNWLEYVRTILMTSRSCAEIIEKEKTSILTHCSDGWDRTAQVVCLTELMLDPYYRTIEGFGVLCEKDWLSFGHKFHTRLGHGQKNFFEDQRGPIFLQFIECVYQMFIQFPCHFEFNETFLLFLADSMYTCRFGTFLFDTMRERVQGRVPERTTSIWTHVLANKAHYFNPFFNPEAQGVIYPDIRHCSMRFWSCYYLRFFKGESTLDIAIVNPAKAVTYRGMDLLNDIDNMDETRKRIDLRNEATVQTFQRELKTMWDEIARLKRENEAWQSRYERDTTALLDLCEKQKEELARWSKSGHKLAPNQSASLTASNSGANTPSSAVEGAAGENSELRDMDEIIQDIKKERDMVMADHSHNLSAADLKLDIEFTTNSNNNSSSNLNPTATTSAVASTSTNGHHKSPHHTAVPSLYELETLLQEKDEWRQKAKKLSDEISQKEAQHSSAISQSQNTINLLKAHILELETRIQGNTNQ